MSPRESLVIRPKGTPVPGRARLRERRHLAPEVALAPNTPAAPPPRSVGAPGSPGSESHVVNKDSASSSPRSSRTPPPR